MRKLMIDLDSTICVANPQAGDGDHARYEQAIPVPGVIDAIRNYKARGIWVAIFTSRNMRTYEGDLGKIREHTLPRIERWLQAHDVPFDEIIVGKPWCGPGSFYVDDRSIRPSEFAQLSPDEIERLLQCEAPC